MYTSATRPLASGPTPRLGSSSTDRADAGDIAAAEKAEVEERQEEEADSDMAQLQFRPGDLLVPVLRLVAAAAVAFRRDRTSLKRSKCRLDEHPDDESGRIDGVKNRLVREREYDKDGAEGEEEDAQPLEERLPARSAVQERQRRRGD